MNLSVISTAIQFDSIKFDLIYLEMKNKIIQGRLLIHQNQYRLEQY